MKGTISNIVKLERVLDFLQKYLNTVSFTFMHQKDLKFFFYYNFCVLTIQ
jgi:hypothetical protein